MNPYVIEITDMTKISTEGLPVKQKEFHKNMAQTNIKSYYNVCDGYYWMNKRLNEQG